MKWVDKNPETSIIDPYNQIRESNSITFKFQFVESCFELTMFFSASKALWVLISRLCWLDFNLVLSDCFFSPYTVDLMLISYVVGVDHIRWNDKFLEGKYDQNDSYEITMSGYRARKINKNIWENLA